jgi:hypothetical protein
MKIKDAAGLVSAIIIAVVAIVTATVGHYAEAWGLAYFIGIVFAMFGGLAVAVMVDAP